MLHPFIIEQLREREKRRDSAPLHIELHLPLIEHVEDELPARHGRDDDDDARGVLILDVL